MDEHFFVSYSAVDAADFALTLADELVAGPPSYRVWVDRRDLRPGEDWDEQIVEALRTCAGVLFVLSEDSVGPNSVCKQEWVRALKYKKRVSPLRLDPDAELPFRLGSRQFIDFSGDFALALAQLRKHLAWTSTPEGALEELRTRLADARRELPRVTPERQLLVEAEIIELNRRIETQQRLIKQPGAARKQTTKRIKTGLERERHPERPVTITSRSRFINPPPMTAPLYFQGRTNEIAQVADCLRTQGLRITTVVGRGGIGKTALVCQLLQALQLDRIPDDLGDLTVDGIVYLSPVGAHPVNFTNLFTDLCQLLPEEVADRLQQRYQDPLQTPAQLMLALLEAFPNGRSVVLLDNFEDIVDTGTGAITDPALDEALRTLLTAPQHGIKVVLTTRVAPRALLLTQPAAQHRLNLDDGLPSPHAENVLRAIDSYGSLGLKTAPAELLARARDRTRGYPRALEALAAILAADRDTTLPELLSETERLPDNVVNALVGEAFNRLDPLAQQVMQALAIYPGPVPPVAVDYLLHPYRATIDAAPVLTRLVNMQLVRRDAGRYYLHQIDRDYALHRLPLGEPNDQGPNWKFAQHALRRRGADYFKQTRTFYENWKIVDDLASPLAEFELRYQAQDYGAAASVLDSISFDYLMLWGHYRLTLDLHQRLNGRLTDPLTNATNLETLGTCYANLGHIDTAIHHHRQAVTIARDIGSRGLEASGLNGLGTCYIHLGQVTLAIDHLQQALTITRDIGDRRGEASGLGNLGTCHTYLEQYDTAINHFQQALTINRDIGNRRGEATNLGNLGYCYIHLGQLDAAIDHLQQALTIDRDIGDRRGEATNLGNLGIYYTHLGQLDTAIDHLQQALTIDRDIGDRRGEATWLGNLGICYTHRGQTDSAIRHYQQATEIADEISSVQTQCEARVSLAQAHLLAEDLDRCHTIAQDAAAYDYAPSRAQIQLVLGIVQLRQGAHPEARQSFTSVVEHTDGLKHPPEDYFSVVRKGLALCGLALAGQPDQLSDAITMFSKARSIMVTPGIAAAALGLLDAIAVSDTTGRLKAARSAVQGGTGRPS